MNTVELQHFLNVLIEGYRARIKNIYFLTNSKAVELLIKVVRQFTSEKIGNRLHACPNLEEFQKVLPVEIMEIMPVEYGGIERSANELSDEWIQALSTKEHVEYMKIMNKACTDESKRHSAKFNEDILGMPGSFRSLSVD